MKKIVFDSGTIISIVTNDLLDILSELKKQSNCEFFISEKVKEEIVDIPLKGKKFKLEAIQVRSFLEKNKVKVYKSESLRRKTNQLLELTNNIFMSKGTYIKILHHGEVESLALAKEIKTDAIAVDERTMRVLIENPESLAEHLHRKLHTEVKVNNTNLIKLKEEVKGIKIIRSTEIMTIAYEKNLFQKYFQGNIDKHLKKELLEGIIWGLKLKGCSISGDEIKDIMHIEKVV
jgi:predicted nucleic acid-binding protein